MRQVKTFISPALWVLALLSLVLAVPAGGDSPAGAIQVIRQDEGFLFQEGERPVLFYQLKPKSIDGKFERSNYIHPLYDLDGGVLTEDFPADHLHQRGVFWAWHQVFVGEKRIQDQWTNDNSIWDVRKTETLRGGDHSSALRVTLDWKSPLWLDSHGEQKPFVEETTTVRAHRAEGDLRKIDFEIRLLALEEKVSIGGSEDVKGYGGFSPRIRLPEDIRFTGRGGPVTPENTSVEAGPWVDFTGSFDSSGSPSGLAVLCHPSLPGFPQRWILRAARSMQNPVYPGREAVPLPRDKPLVLRYRLVLHRGELSRARLDELQAEYAALTL